MPKFKYDKLVRDKIVEKQLASGAKPSFRELSPDEHKHALIKKIIEEAGEVVHAASDEVVAEIADVQQALDDLLEVCGITPESIRQAQQLKNDTNGAFKKGHYIDHVELDEGDEWVGYYRANSDRYPEVD